MTIERCPTCQSRVRIVGVGLTCSYEPVGEKELEAAEKCVHELERVQYFLSDEDFEIVQQALEEYGEACDA